MGSQSRDHLKICAAIHRSISLPILILKRPYKLCSYTRARFFGLVLHGEQSVSSAELRQASVKSPTKGELSSAYALLTVENQTKKPGPDYYFAQAFYTMWFFWSESFLMCHVYKGVLVFSHAHIQTHSFAWFMARITNKEF